MPRLTAVAVLEVMWDWKSRTSRAGYLERAPRHFTINPTNHTGKILYEWLQGYELVATNACPQLVTSASGKGQPDREWLHANLTRLMPFDLVLVCGKVAQSTINLGDTKGARCLFLPHPAARQWTKRGLSLVGRLVREGTKDYEVTFDRRSPSGLSVRKLIPF